MGKMMDGLRSRISSFLVMLETNSARLARLEFLVVVIALLLLLVFVLDTYRHRSRSAAVKYTLLVLDAVSESMVIYTIGLTQSAPFHNEFLSVWIVLLITLRYSTDCISSYGLRQPEIRRKRELGDVMMSFLTANLNSTRNTKFKLPLWLFWSLNPLRVLDRVVAFEVATRFFQRNIMWVAGYMMYEHKLTTKPLNPAVMGGYRYLVQGEAKQRTEATVPDSLILLKITREKKLITLEKIWQCRGRLLQSRWGDPDGRLKDTCLSFALYKILRLRFYCINVVEEEQFLKSQELVLRGILGEEDDERAFRITAVELAFLNDFFYTRYPIVFWNGFPIVNVVLYFATVGIGVWLASTMHLSGTPKEGELIHVLQRVDIDVLITWGLLCFIFLKETWQMVAYLFSDWSKVVLLSKYVERPSCCCQRNALMENLLWLLCRKEGMTRDETEGEQEENDEVVKKGAELGMELINCTQERCWHGTRQGAQVARWKVLADFWAAFLLSLAPTGKTNAHRKALATGGEFITHLWALLSHAGITGSHVTSETDEILPEDPSEISSST